MARAKRQIKINRKSKVEIKDEELKTELTEEENVKIWEENDTKNVENEPQNDENAGTTVTESDESDAQPSEMDNPQPEQPEDDDVSIKTIESQANNVIWTVWQNVVVKPKGQIRFEAQVAPLPMFMLPVDIRRYLQSHWFSSDIWRKDKEWLEKHNVDMEIVEKLKKFLSSNR